MSGYSIEQNLAFIHIPKNAGTSINKALAEKFPDYKKFDDIDKRYRNKRHPAFANHFPVWKIQDLLWLSGSEIPFDGMKKVMVVRNPWDRMVSLYNHRVRKLHGTVEGKPRNSPEDIEYVEKGFKEWLLHTPSRMDQILTTYPQTQWGVDSWGVFQCEVLSFELLDKLFYYYFDFTLNYGLNSGRDWEYQDWYDQETRDHVAHHFARDIDRWGYAF